MSVIKKAIHKMSGKSRADKMAEIYGGIHSTKGYISKGSKDLSHLSPKHYEKEQRMFNSAKREINKLKTLGK